MAYALGKAKILIVDDIKPMLSLTSSVLMILGFKSVFTAPNGKEAFEIVTKEDPDLIITDWIMEPMDGLEFARLVRRSPLSPNPYVPIMMMTGFSSRLRVESARDTGITEFLVKPFSSRDLYARVVQIIERPRQFVDAGTFFGPDRRRRLVKDYDGARRRDNDQAETIADAEGDQKRIMEIIGKLRDEAKKHLMKKGSGKKPRYIKPPNVLKQKVGTGGIDEKLLEKSQQAINESEFDFIPYAQKFLDQLSEFALEARKSNDNFKAAKEKMIGPVMQLKANGGMFRYQLVSDVADIALQFLEAVETNNDDAFEVIRAHQNTIKVIITNKLKGDGGREGYALIKELHQACERYFLKYGKKEEAV